MSGEELTQPGTRINSSVWKRFRQDVKDRRGGTKGHLRSELENAIEEYMNAANGGDTHDRLRRLENNVESLTQTMDTLVDELEAKNKKDSDVGPRTEKKLKRIQNRIEREAGEASTIHESVVNNAIEEEAGGSQPTLKRYKEQMKQRHFAFEHPHPGRNSWVMDEEQFVMLVRQTVPEREDELREEYGRDWYRAVADRLADNHTPGFQ